MEEVWRGCGSEGESLGLLLTRGQIIVFHNCLSMFYDAGTVNLEGTGGREGREGREERETKCPPLISHMHVTMVILTP